MTPATTLYVIRNGRVKISLQNEEGTEVTLALFGAGDFFGEMALLDDMPRSATATAVEPTEVMTLARDQFLAALDATSSNCQPDYECLERAFT